MYFPFHIAIFSLSERIECKHISSCRQHHKHKSKLSRLAVFLFRAIWCSGHPCEGPWLVPPAVQSEARWTCSFQRSFASLSLIILHEKKQKEMREISGQFQIASDAKIKNHLLPRFHEKSPTHHCLDRITTLRFFSKRSLQVKFPIPQSEISKIKCNFRHRKMDRPDMYISGGRGAFSQVGMGEMVK
jgi:hypothetical protein